MKLGRILVVEDEPVTAELLRSSLERVGFGVRVVGEGLGAARAIAEEPPDLILLDVVLSDMDGSELCSMIRTHANPQIAAIPIVMLTSRSSQEDRLKGLKAGADDYITKPFLIEEILIKARNLVSRRNRTHAEEQISPADLQATLHHELRNHLVAVAGFARRIEAAGPRTPWEKLLQYAGFIRRSAEHLISFTEDILIFDKIESGTLDVRGEAVDLKGIVESVLSLMSPLAADKSVHLREEVDEVAFVRFDALAAKLCLSNLVENAIKYIPTGGTVRVRLAADADKVLLEVSDDGPGMSEEEAKRAFDKFYRGGEARKSTKGTGLGLYVVRSLSERLGARLSLETAQGRGCRFRLQFEPAAEPGPDGGG